MAQVADNSLEGRLAQVESGLRALRATNLTDLASVTDASGSAVPLGQLAFGQAVAANTFAVTLTGSAGSPGTVPWDVTVGPATDVRVSGGTLRVDVAAALEAYGNRCSVFAGYRVLGPADTQAGALTAAQAVAPDYTRAIELQDDAVGMNARGAFGTFDVVPNLAPGWYRVVMAYALTYSGTVDPPYGIITNRRLVATPY